jgi:Tfp pilus assembly PilM family ATPase
MARSFPPDVLICDQESLVFARFDGGKTMPRIVTTKTYALDDDVFTPGIVTPVLNRPEQLTSVLVRLKKDQGRVDRVSLLLPDSWFRINLIDIPALPEKKAEADEVVRWSLKKSTPIRPEEFRIAYQTVEKKDAGGRVLVVAALEKTLAAIEKAFAEADLTPILIESVGMNIWNSIAAREQPANDDRVFFYIRNREFTTAVFRNGTPLFFRSRVMSDDRTLLQEIRLSASYFKSNLEISRVEKCYVAGHQFNEQVSSAISEELGATTSRVTLDSYVESSPSIDTRAIEAELTACAGVFTA